MLLLETAAEVCSVALCRDQELISLRSSSEPRVHASALAVYIDDILYENRITVKDLDAVVVSKGPGSYTGLRIGVATAKGLCYASGVPLISVDTLQSMALNYAMKHPETETDTVIVPMLDARRNEVYTGAYSINGEILIPVAAVILDHNSLLIESDKKVIVIGDGAEKAGSLLGSRLNFSYNTTFKQSAAGMLQPATEKFKARQFEDIAYFEPFYLKEFAGGIKKQ